MNLAHLPSNSPPDAQNHSRLFVNIEILLQLRDDAPIRRRPVGVEDTKVQRQPLHLPNCPVTGEETLSCARQRRAQVSCPNSHPRCAADMALRRSHQQGQATDLSRVAVVHRVGGFADVEV